MSTSFFLGYTIIEEPSFQSKIDALRGTYPRIFNDVHETLTWALGRNPEIGAIVLNDPNHRVLKTNAIGETP
jgi:hypothetical protein